MMSFSDRPIARLCKVCGQFHSPTDSHLYDYHQPIDDDLTCQICLQPLVEPVDTKCGHTFCERCIKNFLKLQSMCPNDRNRLTASDLQPASHMIRRYGTSPPPQPKLCAMAMYLMKDDSFERISF